MISRTFGSECTDLFEVIAGYTVHTRILSLCFITCCVYCWGISICVHVQSSKLWNRDSNIQRVTLLSVACPFSPGFWKGSVQSHLHLFHSTNVNVYKYTAKFIHRHRASRYSWDKKRKQALRASVFTLKIHCIYHTPIYMHMKWLIWFVTHSWFQSMYCL